MLIVEWIVELFRGTILLKLKLGMKYLHHKGFGEGRNASAKFLYDTDMMEISRWLLGWSGSCLINVFELWWTMPRQKDHKVYLDKQTHLDA